MELNNSIIKHYLKNVMFITGTPYAGKSTMVKMLADKYGLIHRGEDYNFVLDGVTTPDKFPNLCYDWQESLNRTSEVFAKWLSDVAREIAQFEIAGLMRISEKQKVIVDTTIPSDILREIADYNQVAVMLCPLSMTVENFFDRGDPDKALTKERIMKTENPEKTMRNFLAGIAKYSQDIYDEFSGSGFFTLMRDDAVIDTKTETLELLAKHFGLID